MRTRKAAGRAYDYETLTKRDKLNLDIFWLKDAVTRVKERPGFPSLEHSANLPDPDVIAAEWSEWDERHGR